MPSRSHLQERLTCDESLVVAARCLFTVSDRPVPAVNAGAGRDNVMLGANVERTGYPAPPGS